MTEDNTARRLKRRTRHEVDTALTRARGAAATLTEWHQAKKQILAEHHWTFYEYFASKYRNNIHVAKHD